VLLLLQQGSQQTGAQQTGAQQTGWQHGSQHLLLWQQCFFALQQVVQHGASQQTGTSFVTVRATIRQAV